MTIAVFWKHAQQLRVKLLLMRRPAYGLGYASNATKERVKVMAGTGVFSAEPAKNPSAAQLPKLPPCWGLWRSFLDSPEYCPDTSISIHRGAPVNVLSGSVPST